jgi:hypothetical protein
MISNMAGLYGYLNQNIWISYACAAIWVLSVYSLIRLYVKLLNGRGDVKKNDRFEPEWITLGKWMALTSSALLGWFFAANAAGTLWIFMFLIMLLPIELPGELMAGREMWPWHNWFLRLIQKSDEKR